MSTHYHLLLCDEGGFLSRAMRHIDGVLTQFFNRRRGRDGTLMRGRYRSKIVEEEGYLLEVVRYIHANPVKAGIVERASDYKWSSHGWYLERKAPRWLRREEVLSRFGSVFGCRRARLLRGVRVSRNRERELTMLVCRENTHVRNAELGRQVCRRKSGCVGTAKG